MTKQLRAHQLAQRYRLRPVEPPPDRLCLLAFCYAAIFAAALWGAACVGGGELGGDSNEPSDGGAMLDGEAGDAGGSDGRIVAITDPIGPGHLDGGAAGDAGPAGDCDGDGDAGCNCTGQPEIRRDAEGRLLPHCTGDLAGLVEAAGYICDDAGACIPATTTRACGVECEPPTIFVTARCGS